MPRTDYFNVLLATICMGIVVLVPEDFDGQDALSVGLPTLPGVIPMRVTLPTGREIPSPEPTPPFLCQGRKRARLLERLRESVIPGRTPPWTAFRRPGSIRNPIPRTSSRTWVRGRASDGGGSIAAIHRIDSF